MYDLTRTSRCLNDVSDSTTYINTLWDSLAKIQGMRADIEVSIYLSLLYVLHVRQHNLPNQGPAR